MGRFEPSSMIKPDIARVTTQELEFQETLIAEREAEIREIESGIHELNDIFRDLGTIVSEQGGLIGQSIAPSDPLLVSWLLRDLLTAQTTSSRTLHLSHEIRLQLLRS